MKSFAEIQEQIIFILENEDVAEVEAYLNSEGPTDNRNFRKEAAVAVYSMLDGATDYDAANGNRNSRYLEDKVPVFWAVDELLFELWKEMHAPDDDIVTDYQRPIYDEDDVS